MKDKTVIIIGAGLAGLATGIYAQLNGFQTHIFERAPRPGGVIPCFMTGRHAVMLMCKQTGKTFKAHAGN